MVKMDNNDKQIKEIAMSKGSYMSNAKWSKLLKAVAESDIKYIESEVFAKDLVCDTYWHIRLADYLGDGKYTADGIAGPIRTKDIEYIIIPFVSINELSRMNDLIEKIGKLEYDIDSKKLTIKIFGYR